MLWKVIYALVDRWRREFPGWYPVRHEDLSRSPQLEFARLFAALGLPFTRDIAATIDEFTGAANPAESPPGTSDFRLDSRRNIWNWKRRLTAAEIETIRRLTAGVAERFYSEADW